MTSLQEPAQKPGRSRVVWIGRCAGDSSSSVTAAIGEGWLWKLYQANPLTATVELFHRAFWYGGTDRSLPMPDGLKWSAAVALGIAAAVLIVGQMVFRRLDGRFAQEL